MKKAFVASFLVIIVLLNILTVSFLFSFGINEHLSNSTLIENLLLVFGALLFTLSSFLFLYIQIFSFNLYSNGDVSWKYYFYANYLLFISFPLVAIFGYKMLLLLPLYFIAILLEDIVLLVKSYKLRSSLVYFYNVLVVMFLVVIPLIIYLLSVLYHIYSFGFI